MTGRDTAPVRPRRHHGPAHDVHLAISLRSHAWASRSSRRTCTLLVEIFDGHHSCAQNDGAHRIRLPELAWRWYRVGGADTTLHDGGHGGDTVHGNHLL